MRENKDSIKVQKEKEDDDSKIELILLGCFLNLI